MKKTRIQQIGLILLISTLLSNTTYAVDDPRIDEIEKRVSVSPTISECFKNQLIDNQSKLNAIVTNLPTCKTDAEAKEKAACEAIVASCFDTAKKAEAICEKIKKAADKEKCFTNSAEKQITCIKNYDKCVADLPTKKIENDKKCEETAKDDKYKIYNDAENECNAIDAAKKQTDTTSSTSSGIDLSLGPEIKPNLDYLLYKFTSPDLAEVVTTDYVASLPEEETPGHILGQIIYYMLVVANILAFISFFVSGVFMVASQGNEDDNTKAKKILTYTIIAMIICATALALVTGVTKLSFFRP